MTRKIIAFLGKYPKETCYAFQGEVYSGRVFPEALRQFVDFDEMLVFVTEEAREHAWPVLAALEDERIQPVPIPRGETTAEMWAMFDAMLARVDENDTVIFDITHGLRSAPFLVFLFAAYLKTARNVTIEAVYYGAFELGNPKENIPAPVIDLSEFVTMFDWLTATSRFTETGDGRPLADLLQDEMPPGIQMRDDLEARALGINLRLASAAIDNISLALRGARPLEAMQASQKLSSTIRQTQKQVVQQARPFEVLVDQVIAQYGQFGLEKPTESENLKSNLRHQLAMIRWYLDREQTIQAATLAREWVVSVLVVHFELKLLDRGERKEVEDVLNNAAERSKPHPRSVTLKHLDTRYATLPQASEITRLWSQLTEVRNDLAHVGMRENAQTATKLKGKVESLFPKIEAMATGFLL